MKQHSLPTAMRIGHPLQFEVREIRVNGQVIESATAFNINEGWVEAYARPFRVDEHGKSVTCLHTGIVNVLWSKQAQQLWTAFGGAA